METYTNGDSSFVTLTYDEEHIPDCGSLRKRDLQLFIKRLRFNLHPRKIRYYASGEYGEERGRPHYHLALFGVNPEEEIQVKKAWTEDGELIGQVYMGDITYASARYIAKYIIKGDYQNNEMVNEKLWPKDREFSLMSRRPALGTDFIVALAQKMKRKGYPRVKEVYVGGRKYILGRVLQRVLDRELEVEDVRDNEWQEYMYGFVAKYDDGKLICDGGTPIVDVSQKDFEQKRLQQIKRYFIFKKRNKI